MPCMHPRNRYADQTPDFAALAQSFPELQQHVKRQQNGKASIDFRDSQACKCLTKALLKHDFGITWTIPDGQLVPPLANRANYIHWLEDLLALSSPERDEPVKGMLCSTHVYVLCVCFMCMLLLGSVLVLVSKGHLKAICQPLHKAMLKQIYRRTEKSGLKQGKPKCTACQTGLQRCTASYTQLHCMTRDCPGLGTSTMDLHWHIHTTS